MPGLPPARRRVAAGAVALAALALVAPAPAAADVPGGPGDTPSLPVAASVVSPIPRALSGRDLERIPTRSRIVALTFDAGGDAAGAAAILRTLATTRVTATFFLTGRWARTYPRLARQIAARYPVANHSDTHPDMTRLSPSAAARQLRTAARAIATATGLAPVRLFRFPFGAVNPAVVSLINRNGYACVRWTVDTLGWMGTAGGRSASTVTRRVLAAASPGEIVLMHIGAHPRDGSTLDAAALPGVIASLRARGYRFVTLPDALRFGAP